MRASQVMGPVEFQFTDPDDVAKYGDRWYRYSEAELIRRPARVLVQLEAELGMPLVDAMNGMRMSSVLGDLACSWIGVRDYDPKLAGAFDEWSPLTFLITWRKPAVEEGKAEQPESEADTPPPPADGSPDTGPSRPETSEPTDMVVLQTSPVAG